jgi:ATP-dependent Clp protease protease subunit
MKNRLIRLFKDNAGRSGRLEVRSDSQNEASIYLYDAIGGWYGIAAQDFVRELNALSAETIHLRISSPGGDVFEARAMQTAIRQHASKIVAHIDGLAASAATYVALGANEVEMSEGSFFMIHNAWAIVMGNKAEMTSMAKTLDKIDGSILSDYRSKTKKDEKQIREWMDGETWFTAEEALQHGFIDRIFTGDPVENKWDLSAYDKVPEALGRERESVTPTYDRGLIERRLQLIERLGR